MSEFVHLHVNSHFSLLNSTITIPKLLAATAKQGMGAVALTDRGNLFGAFEAYGAAKDLHGKVKDAKKALEDAEKAATGAADADQAEKARQSALKAVAAAKATDVRLIIGCQLNVTPGSMKEKVRESNQLVLLATSEPGYRNLSKIVSRGWLEGFYFEPRVDLDCIAENAQDLICLTGAGRWSIINALIAKGAKDDAAKVLGRLKDIFADRLYVELADLGPDGPDTRGGPLDWHQLIRDDLELAKLVDVPVVATNWVHYLDRPGSEIHDVMLAIDGATTLVDQRRKRMPSAEYYLKSPDEMAERFAGLPEALANTMLIAERCAGSSINTGSYFLPTFPCPPGETENSLMRAACHQGMISRYGEGITDGHRARLEFELETIEKMGFPAYFLIVADFILWAKANGIPVGPGRGSAAGSLVAYAMGITDICPMRYGLLFERFLNPGRKSMPDIDVDFCKDRRDEVIQYVRRKYGEAAVTNIMTLGTMKARMAIKDVARAYEWTPEESQQLANLVPTDPSGKTDLPVCLGLKPLDPKKNEFATVDAMKSRYDQDPRTKRVLDAAMQLERLGRNLGVHACGIIIAPGPVSEFVPVCKIKDKHATQFNMSQVEKAGLLKMDFLGLKTMSILKKACTIVRESEGVEVDLLKIPLDDPKTFALLGTGRTLGVFQCESRGFQELIARLKPDRFEDMIALVALYRPGPLLAGMHNDYCDRKQGLQRVTYPHPCVEEALKETFGLYIYQEQVMILSRELCGFTPAEADDLRKAMGKKDLKILEKLKEKFINGAWDKWQFSKEVCGKMWESILGFASYCFNKSHSACYGLIAYWTAWFKANHYAAFMTANLIYEMGDKDKMTMFVEELKSQGIEVAPPDLNESGWEFTVIRRKAIGPPAASLAVADPKTENPKTESQDREAIRFGFGGIKAVGEGAAQHLIEERQKNGPFTSLYDVCERVEQRTINKRVVDALIKVGAMDSLHHNRNSLLATMERAYERGARVTKNRNQQQQTLFDTFEQDATFKAEAYGYVEVADWSLAERLKYEKELTGYWMSCHPVEIHKAAVAQHANACAKDLSTMASHAPVIIAAVVVGKRVIKTKSGRFMAILQLEDATGRFEAVLFPGRQNRKGQFDQGPFERFAGQCEDDFVALFTGQVEFRERRAQKPVPMEGEASEETLPVEDEDGGVVHTEEQVVRQPTLHVAHVLPMHLVAQELASTVTIAVDAALILDSAAPQTSRVAATETLLSEFDGSSKVSVSIHLPEGVALSLNLGDRWQARVCPEFLDRLQAIWGKDRVFVASRTPFDMIQGRS